MKETAAAGISDELQRLRRQVSELQRELSLRSSSAEREAASLAALLENTSDAIWSIGTDQRLKFVNSTLCRRVHELFGKVPRVGDGPDDLVPPALARYWRELYGRVLAGESFSVEQEYPENEVMHVYDLSFHPIVHHGEITGAAIYSRDVTEYKRAQQRYSRQSDVLQSIIDNISDGVVVADELGRVVISNPAARRMMRRDLLGINSDQWSQACGLFLPDMKTPYPENQLPLVRAMHGESVDDCLIYMRHDDLPEGIWLSVSARPLVDKQGLRHGGVALVRDITEGKKAGETHAAEQQFLEQLLLAHERDRQLMAYEIHDGLVQDITGALLHLEAIWPGPPGKDRQTNSFELALKLLRESLDEGRRLISGLRPPILDEQGIIAAIDYLIGEHVASGTTAIRFSHDVHFDRLEPLLEGILFRIVQEALNNIRRHSQALTAAVDLKQIGDKIQLQIRDWGIGFHVDQIDKRRFGLRGIRERARLLHGHAEIKSRPGQGTRVFVEFPYPRALGLGGKRSVE